MPSSVAQCNTSVGSKTDVAEHTSQTMISEWLSPDLGRLQTTHHSTCLIPSHSYDQRVATLHGGEPIEHGAASREKKRDDTPTLRFDKFQRTYPCKHASEHVNKCMMCEETRNTNTCRGHTLHYFLTTVPIQLANKKKKRNGTKWQKLSTLHTITHTLKTVDSVFGHTCVLLPVIAHPSRPNPTSQQSTSQRTQELRFGCKCGGVKDKHR